MLIFFGRSFLHFPKLPKIYNTPIFSVLAKILIKQSKAVQQKLCQTTSHLFRSMWATIRRCRALLDART